jgi:hypothetical protein
MSLRWFLDFSFNITVLSKLLFGRMLSQEHLEGLQWKTNILLFLVVLSTSIRRPSKTKSREGNCVFLPRTKAEKKTLCTMQVLIIITWK